MADKKPTQKDFWQAQMLEFFHSYFIGISNLECSNELCPLVANWNELEKKQSKKGKSALLKITHDKYLVVDLTKYEENDLGEVENIEIQFKSGKTQRTKPQDYIEPTDPTKKEIFLKSEERILFFNNSTHTSNLLDAETIYLNDLWDIREKIAWDREKSKKKVFLRCENDPSEETQAKKIDASEKDYLFYISDPSITNEIKEMEVYSPSKGTEERARLYQDYKEEFSELRRVYGIRHLTSKKEERQNNPEIELNEAQFIALERDKKRERTKSIKEAENKVFCQGEHILTYGTSYENREEKALEVKEMEEAKEETKPEESKEILIEK